MKKITLLLLALLILVTSTASAAPTRNLTQEAQDQQELIAQVQPLVDAVAAVAMSQEIYLYQNGDKPDAVLVEALLRQALVSHVLVVEAQDGTAVMRPEDAKKAAQSLFFNQDLPELTAPRIPGINLVEGQLHFDLTRQELFIGAHVYAIDVGEEALTLKADVYGLNGIVASAMDAPEESLVWLGHLGLRLKPDAVSALGFSLFSFSMPERYTPSSLVHFVQKNRFEIQYPGFLTQDLNIDDTFLALGSEDKTVQLTISEVNATLESLQKEWQEGVQAGEEGRVAFIENQRLFMAAPGVLRLAYFDPQNGTDVCILLEMRFPAEKEHEFSLYETFLDNSFVVYSHSVG